MDEILKLDYFVSMPTIKIEVDEEDAKKYLLDIQTEIKSALHEKEILENRISTLEERATRIREQMPGTNGSGVRQPQGQNAKAIEEYLKGLPENKGATPSVIAKATGIKLPSVYYTLQHNEDKFVADKKAGVWKLVDPE